VKLNAAAPSVGEAKAEIARTQGTSEARQELYTVELGNGQMVAMAVKELPLLVWRTCDEEEVVLSEGGAVATKTTDEDDLHFGDEWR
jgi:hypothetical protein